MNKIKSCKLVITNFFYITNRMWKHAPRTKSDPSNLILVTEGTLHLKIGDKKYDVHQGEFVFLQQGIESIGYKPSEKPVGFYCIVFKSNPIPTFPTHFTIYDTAVVQELMEQFVRKAYTHDYPADGIHSLLRIIFYEILYQLNHSVNLQEKSLSDNVKWYIKDTLPRNLTIGEIAMHFGMTATHINRVFSKSNHITLKAYINKVKIRKIEEYLVSTTTTLTEIANKMGFQNTNALSKFYKYHTGKTIGEYRTKFMN